MEVEIEVTKRDVKSKTEVKRLKRAGFIPVITYSKGNVGETGAVSKDSISAILRNVEKGFLPTTIFILKDASNKTKRCVIKEIQYKSTTYDVEHIDFLELSPNETLRIKVPVLCLGANDCVGVKAGGFLQLLMRHLPVRCLPSKIPTHFEVNVRDIEIRGVKRVKDIQMPQGVSPLIRGGDIVVTVVK